LDVRVIRGAQVDLGNEAVEAADTMLFNKAALFGIKRYRVLVVTPSIRDTASMLVAA